VWNLSQITEVYGRQRRTNLPRSGSSQAVESWYSVNVYYNKEMPLVDQLPWLQRCLKRQLLRRRRSRLLPGFLQIEIVRWNEHNVWQNYSLIVWQRIYFRCHLRKVQGWKVCYSVSKLNKLMGEVTTPGSAEPCTSEQEIELYKAEQKQALGLNPLHWWREHAARFPRLAILARLYLQILASSERLFSCFGNIYADRRLSLKTETAQAILFLHYNHKNVWTFYYVRFCTHGLLLYPHNSWTLSCFLPFTLFTLIFVFFPSFLSLLFSCWYTVCNSNKILHDMALSLLGFLFSN